MRTPHSALIHHMRHHHSVMVPRFEQHILGPLRDPLPPEAAGSTCHAYATKPPCAVDAAVPKKLGMLGELSVEYVSRQARLSGGRSDPRFPFASGELHLDLARWQGQQVLQRRAKVIGMSRNQSCQPRRIFEIAIYCANHPRDKTVVALNTASAGPFLSLNHVGSFECAWHRYAVP